MKGDGIKIGEAVRGQLVDPKAKSKEEPKEEQNGKEKKE
jgi:hypothetical protein